MSTTTVFLLTVIALVAMCAASEFVGGEATRSCPQCGHRIRLGVNRCKGCHHRLT